MTSDARYDVVVIGGGPAGERASILAARAGRRVLLVERAGVLGGTRVNWGTIPSKTLRESALFALALTRRRLHGIRGGIEGEITVADFMQRERLVVQRELALLFASLERYGVEVRHGHARFLSPHSVAIEADGAAQVIEARFVVIATGSSPSRPADVPFDGECVFDGNAILELPRIPSRMTVLGAGVIGIEYASVFAALGIPVSLVDTRDRLLPYFDREVVGILQGELQRLGVTVLSEDRHATIERLPGGKDPRVRVRTRAGRVLESDVLLYCVGRDGNTRDLGLESLGITPTPYGLLEVNDDFQTRHPHIYAVGDVIGYPALASTSMEQGRRAIRHALDLPGPRGRTDVRLPFAVYSIPELSTIGETEEALEQRGASYVVGRGNYELNPRGSILGDDRGMVKLLFDAERETLLGVHIVGLGASELVHIGQAYMASGATAAQISETLFNYPTLSDMYRHAALKADGELRRLRGAGA